MKKQPETFGHVRLYHRDTPGGKAFGSADELREALAGGWVDAPWEVDNPEYVVTAYDALLAQPRILADHISNREAEATPPPPEPLKPWQKAQAARKAKAAVKANKFEAHKVVG